MNWLDKINQRQTEHTERNLPRMETNRREYVTLGPRNIGPLSNAAGRKHAAVLLQILLNLVTSVPLR